MRRNKVGDHDRAIITSTGQAAGAGRRQASGRHHATTSLQLAMVRSTVACITPQHAQKPISQSATTSHVSSGLKRSMYLTTVSVLGPRSVS